MKALASAFLMTSTFFFSSSCQTGSESDPKSESQDDKLSSEQRRKVAELKEEAELGRNMAGRLLTHYGTFGNQDLIKYVNRVGNYVGSFSNDPDRKYMFAILANESINAFACPGGYILVTQGFLRVAEDEAELGAVLGHEVAHVSMKHMYKTLKSMPKDELDAAAKNVDLKVKKGEIPPAVKVRERPKSENSEAAKLVARYLSGGAAGLNILSAAKVGMSVILEKGLDKELEFEADTEGVRFAVRAGYAPKGILKVFQRMMKRKKKLNMDVVSKTHPSLKERRKHVKKLLASLDASSIVGAQGTKRFQKKKKLLPKVTK